jgi:predicted nucleic acid-binding protein
MYWLQQAPISSIFSRMKSKVYIETSVISYLTARSSRDLVIAARQEITRERWNRILSDFDCFVSVLVIQEAGGGDSEAAANRLLSIDGIPALQIDEKAEQLANLLIVDGPIPENKSEDALHIALAARGGIEYLLTWNFSHIHNAQMELSIRLLIERFGYQCPIFCSPDELIGDLP